MGAICGAISGHKIVIDMALASYIMRTTGCNGKAVMIYTKKCKECGKLIHVRKHGRFCTPLCRWRNWEKNHPRVNVELIRELNKYMRNKK